MDSKILCPICEEGDAHLKFVETIYFYTCTVCKSDFATPKVINKNKEIGQHSLTRSK